MLVVVPMMLNAQKVKQSEIPPLVISNFSAAHPDIKNVHWEKIGPYFEAEFSIGKMEESCIYKAEGSMAFCEKEIDLHKLPQEVTASIVKNIRADVNIKEISKINSADGSVYYRTEIKHKDYFFTPVGDIINNPVN
jgi:hypothetical protein